MLNRGPRFEEAGVRTLFASEADNPQFVSNVLSFRKRVLVDGLGWGLSVRGGLERDEFDCGDTIHCGIVSGGELTACFRAIRTDRPYLARSKFPQLATKRAYPSHPLAWEISRFAVSESHRRFETAMLTYSAMFYFARARNAVSLVAFSDLSHERLLGRIGVATERFGEPLEIGSDAFGRPVVVVAGEIPIPLQRGMRFEKLVSLIQQTEIDDAAAIFGRSRISA